MSPGAGGEHFRELKWGGGGSKTWEKTPFLGCVINLLSSRSPRRGTRLKGFWSVLGLEVHLSMAGVDVRGRGPGPEGVPPALFAVLVLITLPQVCFGTLCLSH